MHCASVIYLSLPSYICCNQYLSPDFCGCQNCFAFLLRRVNSNKTLIGSKYLPFRVDPFSKGTNYAEANKKTQTIVSRIQKCKTASVAHSDARSTADQGIAGSIPTGTGNILSRRLIMKYFLPSFAPFRWFKKCRYQFLAQKMCTIID